MVHVDVVSQPVKPGLERPSLPTIAADRLPCFEKDLLGQVFGVRMAAGTAIQILVDTLYEEIVEFAEGARVARCDNPIDQRHHDCLAGADVRPARLDGAREHA